MKNIVVIGAGQLGSRHVQGLKLGGFSFNLYIVDPSTEALEIVSKRFEEIELIDEIKIPLSLMTTTDLLPSKIDLLIIATSSIPRFNIFKLITEDHTVHNIVFEKFLFPDISHYDTAEEILESKQIKAWVNCPRRYYNYYREIKKLIENDPEVVMRVEGGEWGLACNSIHFLDIFSFLVNEPCFVAKTELDKGVMDSKRKGYAEFTGRIEVETSQGARLVLIAERNSNVAPKVTIETSLVNLTIDEVNKVMIVDDKMNGTKTTREIGVLYQSQLSGMFAADILLRGECLLTSFNNSTILHKVLLKPFIEHYNKEYSITGNYCPIT